jgi:hypothetical protein
MEPALGRGTPNSMPDSRQFSGTGGVAIVVPRLVAHAIRLERRRGEIKRWNQVHRHTPRETSDRHTGHDQPKPGGAETGASEAHTVAKTILRDVRNHGKAMSGGLLLDALASRQAGNLTVRASED